MHRAVPVLAWFLALTWLLLRHGDVLLRPTTRAPAPATLLPVPSLPSASFGVLSRATTLRSGRIGAGAARSAEGLAWYELACGPNAAEAFRTLAESENPAAVAYGLIWLRAHRPGEYAALAAVVRYRAWHVAQMRGCVFQAAVPMASVLNDIESGAWLEQLQSEASMTNAVACVTAA